MQITKRDGTRVPLNVDKIHDACRWACENIQDVSVSQLQLNARLRMFDGMQTSQIQETLIRSAADLITEDDPNYQYVASRLIQWQLRKEVFGGLTPVRLFNHIHRIVDEGFYTSDLLSWYTEVEWDEIESHIVHDRDNLIAYAGMDLFRSKYLIRNRSTGEIYETPQIAFILIAAVFFHKYPKETRIKWVKEFYDSLSLQEIVLPTPIMGGLRSPDKQFSSCVLIEVGDSLKSIFSAVTATGLYIANRAGIGLAAPLRAEGSPIRGGKNTHTGVFSFYRLLMNSVASCNQGSIRKGSGNMNILGWHLQFLEMIEYKNEKGTPETRLPGLDYTVQVNKLFYERLIKKGKITFFSPNDVPGLYDAFFADQDKFKELYEKYEADPTIRQTSIPALDFWKKVLEERKETGRIYITNVDHCNDHGSFIPELAPIRMTNLCVEIQLPTQPFENPFDGSGEIALCTLAAINWGKIKTVRDFERPARLLVRALDELLDFQAYPVAAGAVGATKRRSLGIGIAGFSHWKAKHGIFYNDLKAEDLNEIDTWAQAWSYNLLKASVDLAKEKGPCELISHTKYAGGILPVDTYKRTVDELVPHVDKQPWGDLRHEMSEHGIRNSTLMALMPGETSTLVPNATNGIEDPRAMVSIKINKDQVVKQVVPDAKKYGKKGYDYVWKQKSPVGYIKAMAILQKYIDQSISLNTSYNPQFYTNEELPVEEMLQHLLLGYRYGHKAWYYLNVADGAGEVVVNDDDCASCKL